MVELIKREILLVQLNQPTTMYLHSVHLNMVPRKGFDFVPLKDQLKAILSLKLIYTAKSVIEKLFWIIISLGGTIYISYIVFSQFNYWNENPVLITKGSMPLSELKLPAITFCHKGAQKFGFVERFVNYLDLNKTIPEEIFGIRNEVIKSYVLKITKNLGSGIDFCGVRKDYAGRWILLKGFTLLTDKTRKRCQVNEN